MTCRLWIVLLHTCCHSEPVCYPHAIISLHCTSDQFLISSEVSYAAKAIWPPSSKGSPPIGGNHTSSESTGSVSPVDIHAPDLEGEDPEVEVEPAFLLEAPSRSFKYVFMHFRHFKVFTREVVITWPRSSKNVTVLKKGRMGETWGRSQRSLRPIPRSSSSPPQIVTSVLTHALDRHHHYV